MTSTLDADAKKLLRAIAEAKKAAIALHELQDDELPGAVGDFILLHPDGRAIVATDAFMQRAAMAFLAAERFQPNMPKPKLSPRDVPRARKLVAAMRVALRTKRADDPMVVGPPNAIELAQAAP